MKAFPVFMIALGALLGQQIAAGATQDLPQSVQMFYIAVADLKKADDRPVGATPQSNIARITPIFKEIVSSGSKVNRAELNAIYPGLGDHFLDDAVAHARLMLQVIDTQDDDTYTQAMAAIIRWQRWWQPNQRQTTQALVNRFG